ncbi:hypothetical protein [Polyangium mundeleinium]|uniref:Sigma-70 family RNA polymerase sigma factor n=1 Tax=Polyangium mundeleinium TaxID=2995306 RepID=A0ABT5ETA3_9BACT|nr:hypothetical protein [Polyangium mundeleinium]MDC0744699.1 hypothetical protein [Polyangium mundeleinium]
MTRVLDDCSNELGISREATLRYLDVMAAVVRSVGVDSAHGMDIDHHAFLLACRKPKAERPDPYDEEAFGAWLNAVAKYAALTNRAWATMRERMDNVTHRARIVVNEPAARAKRRRRRRIGAIPLALFGLVAREARAQVGSFWTRLVVSLHRTPARFIGSLGDHGQKAPIVAGARGRGRRVSV